MTNQLEPITYESVKCLACGETVRRPSWKATRSGGDGSDFVGETKRRSDFQAKLAVKVRTATFGGYGNGHWHTDLEREGDSIIGHVYDPPFADEVMEVFPWDDRKFETGKTWQSVGTEFLSRREALEAALKVYREEFGCERHYLTVDYFSEERTRKTLAEIRRRTREGD